LEKLFEEWDQENPQPPSASDPSGRPTNGAPADEPDGLVNGGVPVLITSQMKTQLRACGYITAQIKDRTPADAHMFLRRDDC
jgi:hypothetical protein